LRDIIFYFCRNFEFLDLPGTPASEEDMPGKSVLFGTPLAAPGHKAENPAGPDLLTPAEASRYVRLAPQTLSRWRCEGRGPDYFKLGGKVFYGRQDLDAFIAGSRVDGSAVAA
jgi:hypothetical protein